jgi:hypothetical protein
VWRLLASEWRVVAVDAVRASARWFSEARKERTRAPSIPTPSPASYAPTRETPASTRTRRVRGRPTCQLARLDTPADTARPVSPSTEPAFKAGATRPRMALPGSISRVARVLGVVGGRVHDVGHEVDTDQRLYPTATVAGWGPISSAVERRLQNPTPGTRGALLTRWTVCGAGAVWPGRQALSQPGSAE